MTDERKKVWPKLGLLVRDDARVPYPAEGVEVVMTRSVLRRVRDGDLVLEDPATARQDKELAVTKKPLPEPPSDVSGRELADESSR